MKLTPEVVPTACVISEPDRLRVNFQSSSCELSHFYDIIPIPGVLRFKKVRKIKTVINNKILEVVPLLLRNFLLRILPNPFSNKKIMTYIFTA